MNGELAAAAIRAIACGDGDVTSSCEGGMGGGGDAWGGQGREVWVWVAPEPGF